MELKNPNTDAYSLGLVKINNTHIYTHIHTHAGARVQIVARMEKIFSKIKKNRIEEMHITFLCFL